MESSSTELKNIKFRHILANSDPTETDFMNQFAIEKKRLKKLCRDFKSIDEGFIDIMN